MSKRSINFVKCDRCGTECQVTFQPHVSVPQWGKIAGRAPDQQVLIGDMKRLLNEKDVSLAKIDECMADLCPTCTISFLHWFKRQGDFKQ